MINVLRLPLNNSLICIYVQMGLKLLAKTGSLGPSYGEWYCALIEPIRSFLARHGSRRDSETSWLLDVRTTTNPLDKFISSKKTKISVLKAEWADKGYLGNCAVFDRTEHDKDRAGPGRMRTGEAVYQTFPFLFLIIFFGSCLVFVLISTHVQRICVSIVQNK